MNWATLGATFFNGNTGLGDANRDAIAGMGVFSPNYLEREILYNAAFHWAIKKALEFVPSSAFSVGGTLQLGSDDGDREIIDAVNYMVNSRNRVAMPDKPALQIARFFVKAQIEANRTGGAGILIDIDDGLDLGEPVNLNRIKSVRGLRLFNRFSIHPVWQYGYAAGELEPEYYQLLSAHSLRAVGSKIHKSRILPFLGAELPLDDISWLSDGWLGDSIIRQMLIAVARFDGSLSAVADKMQRFETPIIKIKGLLDNLTSDRRRARAGDYEDFTYQEKIKMRAQTLQKGWSAFRMLMADMDNEEISTIAHTFAGVAPNLQAFRDALIGASGLPEFILFNRHGSGLGQVEMGERAAIAALANTCQTDKYQGNLETLLTYYFLSQNGVTKGELPDSWRWEWLPLWQPTEEEKAKTALTQAQTVKTLVDCAVQNAQLFGDTQPVLTNHEIREASFGGAEFGGLNIQLLDEDVTAIAPDPLQLQAEVITDEEKFYPPEAARNNAKKALEWKEKYPEEIRGGTQVGWTRASQLAKGEGVSLDIVKRMAQFNRHRQNSEVATEFKNEPWKDAGYVAWLIWGGSAGIDWAKKELGKLDNKLTRDYYVDLLAKE
jgi:phage-related protein (TIGR01555 family)